MSIKYLLVLFLSSVLFVAGCGGGGSSDDGDATAGAGSGGSGSGSDSGSGSGGATTGDPDAEQLVEVASNIAVQMIVMEESPMIPLPALPIPAAPTSASPAPKTGAVTIQATESLEPETQSGDCGGQLTTSGSVTVPNNPDALFPIIMDVDVVADSFCMSVPDSGGSATLDGTLDMYFEMTDFDDYVYDIFYDFAFTAVIPGIGTDTGRISERVTCTMVDGVETCDSDVYYEDVGGDYTLEESEISGDNVTGYTISGDLVDDEGNTHHVEGTGLTTCDEGGFQTGTITVTYEGGAELVAEFLNCEEVQITFQGETWIVEQ